MTSARYLRVFFAVIAGGLLLAAGLNLVVDPYASFHWSDMQGFNDQKHLKRGGGRINKSVILSRYDFDTLFFGTSRAELGLNPNSPVLDGLNAFNAAQAGTSMTEIRLEALFAADHQKPGTVIIDLDVLTFTPTDDLSSAADFGQSPFAGRSLIPIMLERLVSLPSLADCITVMRNSIKRKPDPFTKFGYYDRTAVTYSTTRRQAFTVVMEEFLTARDGYRYFDYRPERVGLLADVIRRFHAQGTTVLLFISPLHARQLEAMWEVGMFPAFEQWKRDLTGTVAMIRSESPHGAPIRLWDFSGYSSITTEPVGETMRWYWESSHYTKEAGDLVLARLLERPERVAVLPDDFGQELSPATVDAVLASIRDGHAAYGRDFPAELEDVRAIARRTAPSP